MLQRLSKILPSSFLTTTWAAVLPSRTIRTSVSVFAKLELDAQDDVQKTSETTKE